MMSNDDYHLGMGNASFSAPPSGESSPLPARGDARRKKAAVGRDRDGSEATKGERGPGRHAARGGSRVTDEAAQHDGRRGAVKASKSSASRAVNADDGAGRSSADGDRRRYRVPAAARALELLEYLAGGRAPVGVSEAARKTGIPKSSCFALLTTLEQAGYVRKDENDEWALTLHIYHVGLRAARNTDIESAAEPVLNALCEATGLTAHLAIFDGNAVVYAMKVEPPGAMVKFDTYPGKRASLHLTAIGRAVASTMDNDELEALLDGYEFSGGENSKIHTRARFMKEIQRVRKDGYAVELEEETTGVACIAAPVRYPRPVGIGLTGLAGQIRERLLARTSAEVADAAATLSRVLGQYDAER